MAISPIVHHLQQLHQKYADLQAGHVADYIPELSKANPAHFAICLVTTDGQVYEVGDSRELFTIQSISKPLVYGMALEHLGHAAVLKKVGVEPTGEAFNSISLHPDTGVPANPMINAGAIAVADLMPGSTALEKFRHIMTSMEDFVGHPLTLNEAVYSSENSTGHRNRAIAHLLRNFNIIEQNPEAGVDAYFRQCSINVDCRDLGMIAATLANNGVHPVTGKRTLSDDSVTSVLAVMSSCGMYNFAGEWGYRVGIPAKSGVGGGIMAVLPGKLGIGIFSPPLDALGNSVRGIRVCEDLAHDFNLHLFHVLSDVGSVLRKIYDVATITSKRRRSQEDAVILRGIGKEVSVIELQGELDFANTEVVLRTAIGEAKAQIVILDFLRVSGVDDSSADLLFGLWQSLREDGKTLVITRAAELTGLMDTFHTRLEGNFGELQCMDDLDAALEWAENKILAGHSTERLEDLANALHRFDVLAGLNDANLVLLNTRLHPRKYRAGDILIKPGDTTREMYLLTRGKVSTLLRDERGKHRRIATHSPGMSFGEMALIDQAPRSALVRADTLVECLVLPYDDFSALAAEYPAIKDALLEGICRELSRYLRKANNEIMALAQ